MADRRSWAAVLGASLVVPFLGLFEADALAQEGTAVADALFADGKRLLAEGKTAEACAKFEASAAASVAIGTLMNLGDCRDKEGKSGASWEAWSRASAMARAASDDRVDFIAERMRELEPKVRRATLEVVPSSELLRVTVAGRELPSSAWGLPTPFDAERVDVVVARAGDELERRTVELPAGAVTPIVLDLAAIAKAHPVEAPPTSTGRGSVWSTGVATLSVGLAGVATFGVLQAVAFGQKSSAFEPGGCVERADGTYCTPQGFALMERAGDFAEAGQWIGVAGGALVAVGLTMALLGDQAEPEVVAAPLVVPGGFGLAVRGRL